MRKREQQLAQQQQIMPMPAGYGGYGYPNNMYGQPMLLVPGTVMHPAADGTQPYQGYPSGYPPTDQLTNTNPTQAPPLPSQTSQVASAPYGPPAGVSGYGHRQAPNDVEDQTSEIQMMDVEANNARLGREADEKEKDHV